MPELPEVETVRRGLEPVMAGARIVRVEQRRPDLRFPFPERFVARLEGRRVVALARRAKYLLAEIDSGETLLMHLGMSGRFTISGEPLGDFVHATGTDPRHDSTACLRHDATARLRHDSTACLRHDSTACLRHDHAVLHMEGGATVTYNDPRRFGFMLLVATGELDNHPLMRDLGVEPLGNALHAGYLAERARGRKADLKAFLLDQRIVAGLGNIYVSEALHRAGISPHRAAACLSRASGMPTDRCARLVPAIRTVLEAAIAAGGSTLRDYKRTDGALGYFQHQFLVYGRDGEPCLEPGCEGIVRRTIQAGRSTFHCPSCQH